jgi:hypothetical protein
MNLSNVLGKLYARLVMMRNVHYQFSFSRLHCSHLRQWLTHVRQLFWKLCPYYFVDNIMALKALQKYRTHLLPCIEREVTTVLSNEADGKMHGQMYIADGKMLTGR